MWRLQIIETYTVEIIQSAIFNNPPAWRLMWLLVISPHQIPLDNLKVQPFCQSPRKLEILESLPSSFCFLYKKLQTTQEKWVDGVDTKPSMLDLFRCPPEFYLIILLHSANICHIRDYYLLKTISHARLLHVIENVALFTLGTYF